MLQSGLLIPVHERSKVCLFDNVLTDIGDNQSIENHLSTYSYRLKNMNYFLRKCNDKTLFLIDEFGTGSDPELGGALAETFLEVFMKGVPMELSLPIMPILNCWPMNCHMLPMPICF